MLIKNQLKILLLCLTLNVFQAKVSYSDGFAFDLGNTIGHLNGSLDTYVGLKYKLDIAQFKVSNTIPLSDSGNLTNFYIGSGINLENKHPISNFGWGFEVSLMTNQELDFVSETRFKLISGKTELFSGLLAFTFQNRLDVIIGLSHNF